MKILILRFSSIGDIVLTTPVIEATHKTIQEARIHYLTKKQFVPLLASNQNIEKIYSFERSTKEILPVLQAENYDVIIDLHNNIRTYRLKKKIKTKNYTFNKLNVQKWLLVNFKYQKMPDLHVVDRYFGAVKSLGVVNDGGKCRIIIDEADKINTVERWNIAPKSYLAVAIGAQFATKIMPTNRLIEILQKINYPIILLGGKNDIDRGKEIFTALQAHTHPIINAVGNHSLMQSASIVQQSKTILTHDTGLMHIASAFGIQIVSIWGNTVPQLGMYPYYPQNKEQYSIHQVENLSCRPCSKIGFKNCPKKHFNCMNLQNIEAIQQDINQRMLKVESNLISC